MILATPIGRSLVLARPLLKNVFMLCQRPSANRGQGVTKRAQWSYFGASGTVLKQLSTISNPGQIFGLTLPEMLGDSGCLPPLWLPSSQCAICFNPSHICCDPSLSLDKTVCQQ